MKARPQRMGGGMTVVRNPPMVSSRTRVGMIAPSTGIYGPRFGPRPITGVRLRGRR